MPTTDHAALIGHRAAATRLRLCRGRAAARRHHAVTALERPQLGHFAAQAAVTVWRLM